MNLKPIIYLNHLKSDKEDISALFFKDNKLIAERISQNNWIAWNSFHKAYCVKSGPRTIALITDLFEDIAVINTNYYEAKLKGHTDEITIGDATYFTGVLELAQKIGKITLFPYKKGSLRLIVIKYH
ncbi:hypothetical protein [Tenacibaculum sp.]|uniref:hypothetical protein n=1 Tax=Tenacibaculum sp. TaxID=1906242 RepID=UPI003D14438E